MKAALRRGLAALGLVALALPGTALAGYGLQANVITEVTNFPAADRKDGNLWLDRDPLAASLQAIDRTAQLGPGAKATGLFLGSVGLLKAYAGATYPLNGGGLASSTVTSSFYDNIDVVGAGLAVGTPVSYRLDFSISGTVLGAQIDPSFGAIATSSLWMRDESTGKTVALNWDNRQNSTGLYSLTLNTTVGHSLFLYAELNVAARVQGNSLIVRSTEADFYHSARYALTPSVAGLNVVGQSGHDYTVSAVPEPSSWALMALGLTGVVLRRRAARQRG